MTAALLYPTLHRLEREAYVVSEWRTGQVSPESAEQSVREIYWRDGSLRSPNREWIAIKSQHIYGPQDVVLIKPQ